MCLAVPGKLVRIKKQDGSLRTGTVDFGGVCKQIHLAFVPQAAVGDYVLVHVGFAIQVIDEAESLRLLEALESLEEPLLEGGTSS